jgi:Family of unknown function (DUF6084)
MSDPVRNGTDALAPADRSPVAAAPASTDPEFTITGVERQAHAASPMLRFTVRVNEPRVAQVYMIALTAQINIDPAQRSYDDETRARLFELFGEPRRWASTTRSFLWTQADVLMGGFAGSGEVVIPVACTYDLEVAASKYFYSLPDGEVPLTFHFAGRVYYPDEHGRIALIKVPWSCSSRFRMPVETWKALMREHYGDRGWVALHGHTLDELQRFKAERGLPTFDACVSALLQEGSP